MKYLKIISLSLIVIFVVNCSTEKNSVTDLNSDSNNKTIGLRKLSLQYMTNAEIHNYLLDFVKTKYENDSIQINLVDTTDFTELIDSTKAVVERMGIEYGFNTEFPDNVINFTKNLDTTANSIFDTNAYQNIYNELSVVSWKKALLDSLYSFYTNGSFNVPSGMTGNEKESWDIVIASHQWWIIDENGPFPSSSYTIDAWSGLVLDALGTITSGPISGWACSIMWEIATSYIGKTPF